MRSRNRVHMYIKIIYHVLYYTDDTEECEFQRLVMRACAFLSLLFLIRIKYNQNLGMKWHLTPVIDLAQTSVST